jgi:DNA-binding transcriptional ArsR family regulator
MSTCSNVQEAESHLFGPDLVTALADTFKVLGDATRVRILDVLSRRELCVGDIADTLGLSESAVSHQLRLLRTARLVRQRRAGQMMFYALDDHHVIRLFAQATEHVKEQRQADTVGTSDIARAAMPPAAASTADPTLDSTSARER